MTTPTEGKRSPDSGGDTVSVASSNLGVSTNIQDTQLFINALLALPRPIIDDRLPLFASQNSEEPYNFFKKYILPNVQNQVTDYVQNNGGFCLDVGCGYMQVGRELAKDFGVRYIGIDIVDHPNGPVLKHNPSLQLDGNDVFIQMDVITQISSIPEGIVPLLFLNNFDPSTYFRSGGSFDKTYAQSHALRKELLLNIGRIAKKGGYIITLGTTIPLRESFDKFLESLPGFSRVLAGDNSARIFRKN